MASRLLFQLAVVLALGILAAESLGADPAFDCPDLSGNFFGLGIVELKLKKTSFTFLGYNISDLTRYVVWENSYFQLGKF